MSRRDSDSRHHRSRYDRDPSPKRVKRDGKSATEKPTSNHISTERIDRDKKHHHRLQDSVSLGPTSESVPLSKESDRKSNGYHERTKHSSENIEAPRSRSRFQHDERAGQVGRSFRHKETTERERWKDKKLNNENNTKFDGSHKVEPDSKQLPKKRPSFRETKLPVNESATTQVTKITVNAEGSERKEERRLAGGKDPHRNETHRMKFQSRGRYGGGNGGGGGGGSFRGSGGRVDKWKHDLYDEANKSPNTKNEEDQIAKVEALLAS